jgi:hypothetical protein
MKMKRIYATLLIVSFLICAQASAVVYVKDIQLGFGMSTWYDVSEGKFQLVDSMGSDVVQVSDSMGVVNTWENTLYDYRITNATFSMTPCSLVNDNNPGGVVADGTFTGGAMLSVIGSIQQMQNGLNVGSPLFTGTLLTATMEDDNWDLEEDSILIDSVRGDQPFVVTGGELATGSVSGLKMLDFNGVFTMDLNASSITDFSSTDYISFMPQIQFVAPVPEPATMLLLLTGGMLLRRKRY